jgi:1-acyl-sn-glycerol-3-phosphate acyltransferase
MRLLLKLLQIIYTLYAMLIFVVLMVPVFVWSFLVSFLGRIRGGNLIYKGCIWWADVWFAFIFIRHKNIFKEALRPGQPYIFVANHISFLDAAAIPKTFRFAIRPLGKVEMAKVPLFGFIYKKAIVTVDRSSPQNRTRSVQILKSILRKGISILVFPEGTFNETGKPLKEFYDGAFRIAIETGTPLKPVLLLDTYSRLHYSSVFSLTPGVSRAVFLPEIPVEGLHMKDVGHLKERVHKIMERELVAYRAAWIRED